MRRLGLIVAVVLLQGCSGGHAVLAPAVSPGPVWRAGEIKEWRTACSSISTGVLKRLRVVPNGVTPCTWREDAQDQDDHVERTLSVTGRLYEPSAVSATDAARRGFEVPQGWEKLGKGVPVRGLGDEAKIVRRFLPGVAQRRITLAVRLRNAVTSIDVTEESLLDRYRGRVPSFGVIEAAAVDAARDVLKGLGSQTGAQPSPAYLPTELRTISVDCGPAARVVRGVSKHGGCEWDENDGERPSLTVAAEVIAPSPATGESGTRIATALFGQWKHSVARAPKLGDEAALDHFTFESGLSRSSSILVRRANLLVFVDYGLWHHPGVSAMDAQVIALANGVLKGHPR